MNTQITAEEIRRVFSYDPETGVFVRKVSTGNRSRVGAQTGSKMSIGYIAIRLHGRLLYAHRLAWLYVTGEWPSREIDHIDRDRANNRWSNLRLAERSENSQNRGIQGNNTSGHKGVWWHRQNNKWCAEIKLNGKKQHLGIFKTIEEAVECRSAAAAVMHPFST